MNKISSPDTHEIYARRKGRNYALGGCLLALVLMIFAVSIVKMRDTAEIQRGFNHTFETTPGVKQ